jgi:hypothetical protein
MPVAAVLGATLLAACGQNTAPSTAGYSALRLAGAAPATRLKTPALIALDNQTGQLEYWPITQNGSDSPQVISGSLGVGSEYGMVGDGRVVAFANYSPAEVVTYDLRDKVQTVYNDPYGNPIDLAISKKHTLYALNLNNVAVYPRGSSQPSELTCQFVTDGVAIAVDNEGDVFVNGYGPNGFMGVVEFAAGSQTCTKPHLRAERGYAGGVGVDPKTDDLIVVDNPDLCAGGIEGRMIIYPKPYRQRTSHRRILWATYCAGTFRLDATSTHIFFADSTVSAGFPLIGQRTYPEARGSGVYQNGDPGGFTTIPNTLPN